MIRVYTAPGSQSCRKVSAWLKEHNLSFIEKNIFQMICMLMNYVKF